MKAAQINKYSKNIDVKINEIPIPDIKDNEVLIKVKAIAINPVDILNLQGAVKLIHDYKMPLTLGNECSGLVEKVGKNITAFTPGDRVYSRVPISTLGAFAEYVVIAESALAHMPNGYSFESAAAIPLTGLTAYQAAVDILKAKEGETVFIPGGSGSFGQMAVPILKALNLKVILSGNKRSRDSILALGADKYIVYTEENYYDVLSNVDYVIDALGLSAFDKELSVLKEGGTLLTLRGIPNREFAKLNSLPAFKRVLFTLA